jgi:transposase
VKIEHQATGSLNLIFRLIKFKELANQMCYETNLTDARWEIIAEFIEDGRKRKNSLRTIVGALLYVVKTGCQWRYLPKDLPKDFPKWQLVYYYFRKFETTGLIEMIHDTLREKVRVKKGKQISPSLGLVDSQRVSGFALV